MSSRNELAESTIMIAHHEKDVRSFVDNLVKDIFDDQETYSSLELDAYRDMMLRVQVALNDQRYNRAIVDSIKTDLIS